ncbi:hypothetical protein BE20_10900 [Sorangium cellulosum]|nr:hypothetical protein BE20_10900 [Sorangium cellulosum]
MAAILAERGIVLATLAGIPKRDRADVEQQVLANAWNSVRRGMYRPARDKRGLVMIKRCVRLQDAHRADRRQEADRRCQ